MVKRMLWAALFVFFIAVRFIPIGTLNFPFAYDNAKDSLSMLSMWQTHKPVLLGPVTSLEGLYQGPLWYYLALPLNVLAGFHPFASVLTVMILGLLALFLIVKKAGWWEALLYATAIGIIPTHQTAWTPYIIQFPILLLLLWVWKLPKRLRARDGLLIALCLGSLFHFEIAFAVVFIPLFFLCLWFLRTTIDRKAVLVGLPTFLVFFTPHLLFELKHHFLQTKGVIAFILHFHDAQAAVAGHMTLLQRLLLLAQSYLATTTALSPLHWLPVEVLVAVVLLIAIVLLAKGTQRGQKQLKYIVIPMILGSALLYVILPFKPFYLISLLPLWILVAGTLLRRLKPSIALGVIALVIATSLISMVQNRTEYQRLAAQDTILYASRLAAVQTVEKLSGGTPFVSYQYVPEVYDFTYQVAYWQYSHTNHVPLPDEISYKAGVSDYNPWAFFVKHQQGERTFLIVEKDNRPNFLPNWWQQQMKGKHIVQTVPVNASVTVFEVAPTP